MPKDQWKAKMTEAFCLLTGADPDERIIDDLARVAASDDTVIPDEMLPLVTVLMYDSHEAGRGFDGLSGDEASSKEALIAVREFDGPGGVTDEERFTLTRVTEIVGNRLLGMGWDD